MNNLNKLIAIFSLLLIASSLLIAQNSPATGYELDIYKNTPTLVWIFIILSFFGGASIILHQVVTRGYETSKFWTIGIFILILARITLLYIPYVRGYVLWSGDNISYLGLVKDILINGHFSPDNFYPIIHLLLAQIILATGLPDIIIVTLSTAIISVIFVLSIYLLAEALNLSRGQQLFSTLLAGSVMIAGGYNVILSPNGWSILLLPLLLFFYFKQESLAYRVPLILFLVMYPFFHPLSALMIITALVIIEICRRILALTRRKSLGPLTKPGTFTIAGLFMELVIFTSWTISFRQFQPGIQSVWYEITHGLGTGKTQQLLQSLDKLNIHGADFYILIFKMYGVDMILIFISIIGIFWMLINLRRSKGEFNNVIPIAFIFIFIGLLYAAYLLGLPGTREIAEGQWDRRILSYMEILLPLIAFFALFKLSSVIKFHKLAYGSVMVLIFLISGLSIVSLFPSPYVEQPNLQITRMNMSEMNWFINEKDINVQCVDIFYSVPRTAEGILGVTAAEKRPDLKAENTTPLNNHFGYDTNNFLGGQYTKDKYAALTSIDSIVYNSVWQSIGRFNYSDFNKLELDPTVNKLYANEEGDVYYISSIPQGN